MRISADRVHQCWTCMFPDPWTQNTRAPQQSWYGVSRSLPHVGVLRRLVAVYPGAVRVVPGVGSFLGPVTRDGHDVTWKHHGLRPNGDDTYWWCVSDVAGGFGVGQRLWSHHARIAEVVAGFRTPRSRTALVRVNQA